jgi:CubicO group peptidase (beta-lactamase class C family)
VQAFASPGKGGPAPGSGTDSASEEALAPVSAASSPDELARALVTAGVATEAAVGFAFRRDGRWEFSSGGATSRLFDLASVTKPVTAMALARSGLDRRTRLGTLLEEARGTPSEEISLELLLAHRAGLEAHTPMYASLLDGTLSRAAALRAAASARGASAVGRVPALGFAPVYSDLGYILAGEALARAVGLADAGLAIARLVVGPLGREDDLGTARELEARGVDMAVSCAPTEVVRWRGGAVRGRVHDENAWALTGTGGSGHAGLFGSVGAALAFGVASLDAIARDDGPLRAGDDLGWLVAPRPGGTLRAGFDGKSEVGSSAGALAGPGTFGHLGFTGTSVWVDPGAEIVAVVLTNRVYPTRDSVRIRAARPHAHDALFRMALAARAGLCGVAST